MVTVAVIWPKWPEQMRPCGNFDCIVFVEQWLMFVLGILRSICTDMVIDRMKAKTLLDEKIARSTNLCHSMRPHTKIIRNLRIQFRNQTEITENTARVWQCVRWNVYRVLCCFAFIQSCARAHIILVKWFLPRLLDCYSRYGFSIWSVPIQFLGHWLHITS